jgi:VanZ family protein
LKTRWWGLLFIYLTLLVIGTLAIRGRSPYEWVQLLVPPGRLRDLLVYPLQHHHPVTFANLFRLTDTLGNILLFFPVGMGIFAVFYRVFESSVRKLLIISLVAGLFLSIGIETFQYFVPRRIPSVTDIIANTGGAVFGCYLLCFRKMYQEIKTPEQQSRQNQQTAPKSTK